MKLITQATQINMYSKELVQIYEDVRSKKDIELEVHTKRSIFKKLEGFSVEITEKENRPESEESSSDHSFQNDNP